MGKGVFRTTIKDTWTKPRGRVEVGEGGGFGWGGEKIHTTVIEQQLKKILKSQSPIHFLSTTAMI